MMAMNPQAKEARKSFKKKYNDTTVSVVSYLAKGWDSKRIANKYGISVGTVAAIRSNYTRGAYAPYATHGGGTCQF